MQYAKQGLAAQLECCAKPEIVNGIPENPKFSFEMC